MSSRGTKRTKVRAGKHKRQKTSQALAFSAKSRFKKKGPSKAQVDRAQSIAINKLIRDNKAAYPEIKTQQEGVVSAAVLPIFTTGAPDASFNMVYPRYDLIGQGTDHNDISGMVYHPKRWIFKCSFANVGTFNHGVYIYIMLLNMGSQSNVDLDTIAKIKTICNPKQLTTIGSAFTGDIENFLNTRMTFLKSAAQVGDTEGVKPKERDLILLKKISLHVPSGNTESSYIKKWRYQFDWRQSAKHQRAFGQVQTTVLERGWVPFVFMCATGGGSQMQYNYTSRLYYQEI